MAIPAERGGEEGLNAGLGHVGTVSRAPMAITLASLCSRASLAESGSETSAQRTAGLRLTAMEMPIPDPHSATPCSALPEATWVASL